MLIKNKKVIKNKVKVEKYWKNGTKLNKRKVNIFKNEMLF